MLFIRYGIGVLGMVLAVLAVSHPASTCGPACPSGPGMLSGWEVGEILPGLLGLMGLSVGSAPPGRLHQARASP